MRFERAHAVITAGIAAAGVMIAYAALRHNVEHDRQQQINDMLKVSAPERTNTPLNLNTKAPEKSAEKQPDNPTSQPERKGPATPPAETRKEPPNEASQPFTFWGNFPGGLGQPERPGIMFQVNSCVSVGPTTG